MKRILLAAWLAFAPFAAFAQDGVVNPQTNASALTTGTVAVGRMPALTGDCTTSAGAVATTCTKINGVDQTVAWTPFTPTITCGQATGTAVCTQSNSSYKLLGKTVLGITVTVTVSGTFTAGTMTAIQLPFTVGAGIYSLHGRNSSNGVDWECVAAATSTSCTTFTTTNTNTITAGDVITLSFGMQTN